MSNEDQRLNDRLGISMGQEENQFYIERAGEIHPIKDVRDVSISGMGLEISEGFTKGEKIILNYNSDGFNMQIDGTVMWCDSQHSGSAMGIEFDGSNQGDNTLFFMAMRKYLDEFDSLPLQACQ